MKLKVKLRSWRERWLAHWELKAAEQHMTELGFRESNGGLVLRREWVEAEEWLRQAKERCGG